jgi:hypothetical protein
MNSSDDGGMLPLTCCTLILQDTSEISADLRKAEVFINNRGSRYLGSDAWVGWENYR